MYFQPPLPPQATANHEWFKLATVLVPLFKDLKFLSKRKREGVWTRLEAILQTESKLLLLSPQRNQQRRGDSYCVCQSDSDDDERPSRAKSLYRAEPTTSETDCLLQWWSTHARAHPQQSTPACMYLDSPATYVLCETLFSLAGNAVEKKRTALSSDNVWKAWI